MGFCGVLYWSGLLCVTDREEMSSVKEAVSDAAKDSLSAATDTACSTDPSPPSVTATSFADIMNTSGNCSESVGKSDSWLDSAGASAGNGLNMDDIMEYLQCQDASSLDNAAQNMTSMNASSNFTSDSNNPTLSASDSASASQTLSLVALQNLASECSTIDLSSLCMDSNAAFGGSNGFASGECK